MVWCISCRSAAVMAPARPAGPSRCRWASSWRITVSGRALPSSSSLGSSRTRWPAGGAERVGHRGHQPAGAAVFDDLAELVEHQSCDARRSTGCRRLAAGVLMASMMRVKSPAPRLAGSARPAAVRVWEAAWQARNVSRSRCR